LTYQLVYAILAVAAKQKWGLGQAIVKELNINERIRAREVRLIADDGQQLGIMPVRQALALAEEKNLDLVEVAPTAVPPVCRLLNYGKFRYEQTKKEREARRAHKTSDLRQIRLRPKIDEHDLEAKIRSTKKLLGEGDKVKVSVLFRGREVTHPEIAFKLLQKVSTAMEGIAIVERRQAMEGRMMTMIFAPGVVQPAKEAVKEVKETVNKAVEEPAKETKKQPEVLDAKA
jgi:translation initiation factor IF-3